MNTFPLEECFLLFIDLQDKKFKAKINYTIDSIRYEGYQ